MPANGEVPEDSQRAALLLGQRAGVYVKKTQRCSGSSLLIDQTRNDEGRYLGFINSNDAQDELIQMKPLSRTNGSQSFSPSSSSCSAPSSPSRPMTAPARPATTRPSVALPQSTTHRPQGSGVKKVTGVGGTTYEISV